MKIGHLNGQWKSKEVAKLQCEEEVIRREIQSNLHHVTHRKERITGQIQREKKRLSALQTHHLYNFPRFHIYVLIYNICFPLSNLLVYMTVSRSISVQFSRSVVSDSLRPHESQHARPPCPSPTPGVHSDSRPLSQRCHPAISSSVVPFSSCPQSLPASESFPMSQLFA